jgi:cysteine-rich repeat protein
VGGLGGKGEIVARFDPRAATPAPPVIQALTFSSAGRLTDAVGPGADLDVHVEVGDTAAAVTLLGPGGSVELASGERGWEGKLSDPCATRVGGVDLELAVVDASGNELRHTWRPAFVCVPAGCGNGVFEAGEACDDGNRFGDDGCNASCTSDEQCGNGVLDVREECDDGGIDPGDGCDASCRLEHDCGVPEAVCLGGLSWCPQVMRERLHVTCGQTGKGLTRTLDRLMQAMAQTTRRLKRLRRIARRIRAKSLAHAAADPCMTDIAGMAAEATAQAERAIQHADTCLPGCDATPPWWRVSGIPRRC